MSRIHPDRKSVGRGGGRLPSWLAGLGWGAAAGVALGALVVGPAVDGDARQPQTQATSEDTARAERAEAEAAAANDLLAAEAPALVQGSLDGTAVLVLRAAGSGAEQHARLTELLDAAGADPAGTLTLTEKFTSPEGADQLGSIVANTLPAGTQLSLENPSAATHAGESLADALAMGSDGAPRATADDRAFVLDSLSEAGYLTKDSEVMAADAVVIELGGQDTAGRGFAATAVADFAAALSSRGVPVVISYPGTSAGELESALSAHGDHGVATQGMLETEAGAVSTVRAVRGELDAR